ncbi:MAG: alpha/beta fold hydrolase [Streptosporangiaceae bacterium]
MASWLKVTGIVGIAAGAIAASAGALVAAEKIAVGRIRLRPDPLACEPLGQRRGHPMTVTADDGVPLYAEVSGPDDAPVTVIFCHGYTLTQDCWHFQRGEPLPGARLVFWDQRGHGRSGPSDRAHMTISQTAADLYAILMASAPGPGPVILVGHSMGGMTLMALARLHPELFGAKVAGVALISTAASGVDPSVFLPPPLRPLVRMSAPSLLRATARGHGTALLEWCRRAGGDLAFLTARQLAFGGPDVSPALVDYLERIIRSTPVGVVSQFYLTLLDHDERGSLPVLGRVPAVVITGGADRLIPSRLSEELAEAIPGAQLVRVPGAGHMVILEQPDIVRDVIERLIARALAGSAADGPAA